MDQLTQLLHARHGGAHQYWNGIPATAKRRMVLQLFEQSWPPHACCACLGRSLVDCTSCDVLIAVAEHEPRSCKRQPELFLKPLLINAERHVPRGRPVRWQGGTHWCVSVRASRALKTRPSAGQAQFHSRSHAVTEKAVIASISRRLPSARTIFRTHGCVLQPHTARSGQRDPGISAYENRS